MSLRKYSYYAGFVMFMAVSFLLSAAVPPAECNDGWNSPSIGRQGACSHHGGVNHHTEKYLLAIAIGALSGFAVYALGAFVDRRINPPKGPLSDPFSLGPIEAISHAVKNKLLIEFTYIKPGTPPEIRTLSPQKVEYSPRRGRRAVLCVTGFCHLRKAERTFALSRISNVRLPSPNHSLKR